VQPPTLQVDRSLAHSLTVSLTHTLMQEVTFKRTPPMSTYLVAFYVGRFTYTAASATCTPPDPNAPIVSARVPISIYSTPDTVTSYQTAYAAQVARCVLEVFENYFEIDYPLSKLDLIVMLRASGDCVHLLTCGANRLSRISTRVQWKIGV
jgi:aminopeptidase N